MKLHLDDLEAALDGDWPEDIFLLCECGMWEIDKNDDYEDVDEGHAILAVAIPHWERSVRR